MKEILCEKPKIEIWLGDCLELMKEIPDKSVDLVLTDPPYPDYYKEKYQYKNNMLNFLKNYNCRQFIFWSAKVDFPLDYTAIHIWDKKTFNFKRYLPEIWRIMKNNSDLYVFGNYANFNLSKEKGFKQILIWDKRMTGMGDLSSWGIGYELIYYFKKGNRVVNKRKNPVIFCESLTSFTFGNPVNSYFHPTQKPIGIIEPLIGVSSNENDIVLDPFLGSGTTAVAAKQLGRRFIGIEISEKYCEIARQRLKQKILL